MNMNPHDCNSISLHQQDGDKPIRNFLDDPRRSGPAPDTDRKEGSRRHVRNWGGLDFDNVKTGTDLEKEWTVSHERNVSSVALLTFHCDFL